MFELSPLTRSTFPLSPDGHANMVRTQTHAYRHSERQLGTRKKFYASQKAKRVYKKKSRTPAEQAALKARRGVDKEFQQKLLEYKDKVYDMAEDLHAQFPHRTTRKIYESLMQFARRAATKREVNSWNAYQSMRLEQINDSTYSITSACCQPPDSLLSY